MAITTPWYAVMDFIHHNNTECIPGNSIKHLTLGLGTGGKPLCPSCARLNSSIDQPERIPSHTWPTWTDPLG